MKIQLLYFHGCPNVDAARASVREALASEALDAAIEEIDVDAPSAPPWARAWGSPTILIDGEDVMGQGPSTSPSCRLYAGGAPSADAIRERIARARSTPRAQRCGGGRCARRDLVAGWSAVALWGVPTALLVVGAFVPAARAALWIPSFAVMGLACAVNARQCGRLHCHVTGPLFLLSAIATALDAFAIAAVSWKLVLAIAGLGTLFAYGLEWLRGKYVASPPP